MKNIALLLLLAATAIYVLATALEGAHPAWAYVAASAEAAMVGALADWFAVVALFRHPMGLPIPHTAVIAKNQHRIGLGLAQFFDVNFLSRAQIQERLQTWDGAAWIANWLKQPENAKTWIEPFLATMRFGFKALDESSVQQFVARNAKAALSQIDFSSSAGTVLDSLTADNRHQELLDEILASLGELLKNEATQEHITEAIAKELKALRYLALDKAAARLATRKIIAAIAHNLHDMAGNAEHPMRTRFNEATHRLIESLKHDPSMRARVNSMRDEVLNHPNLQHYLLQIWQDIQQWVESDIQSESSRVRQILEQQSLRWGQYLHENKAMQSWLNAQIQTLIPQVLERYRPAIKHYISERIGSWDTRELVQEIEIHLGKDLQFIRINGTLVGALVGLAIYSLTQWVTSFV